MALMDPCGLLPKKIRIAAAFAVACAWVMAPVAPVAFAQHGGHAGAAGHSAGAGHVTVPRVSAPPAPHVGILRPPISFGRRAGFGQRPVFIRRPIFVRAPFFRLRRGFYSAWSLNCGPAWVWGFGCGDWRLPEYGVENYVAPPLVIYEPEYAYYGGPRDFVLLFLKDGTEYSVTDYWFMKDEVHFIVLEEGGTKSVEQVIGLDELDSQKTIDVNTRRGFRLVRRDEPLEQYLRDHPDANPPLLERPPKS
jgi:hypothetical protein